MPIVHYFSFFFLAVLAVSPACQPRGYVARKGGDLGSLKKHIIMSAPMWLVLCLLVLGAWGQQTAPSTSFSQIDMKSLLQSLNMTEGDLAVMQQQIASNSTNPVNSPVAVPAAPAQGSSAPVQQQPNSNLSSGSSGDQNSLGQGMMDLSLLEQQLGIKSATASPVKPASNNSSSTSSSSSPSIQNSSSPQTTTTASAGSGQIALQGPIPMTQLSHLETNAAGSSAASTISLLDLSDLERQLGLIPTTPAPTATSSKTEVKSNQTTTPSSQQKDSAGTSSKSAVIPTNNTGFSTPKDTSIASPSPPAPQVVPSPAPQITPIPVPQPTPTPVPQSVPSTPVPQPAPSTPVPSASNISKQQQLKSDLAKLQAMLDELTSLHDQSQQNTSQSLPVTAAKTNATSQQKPIEATKQAPTQAQVKPSQVPASQSQQQSSQSVVVPSTASSKTVPALIDISQAKVIYSASNSSQTQPSQPVNSVPTQPPSNDQNKPSQPTQIVQPVQDIVKPVAAVQTSPKVPELIDLSQAKVIYSATSQTSQQNVGGSNADKSSQTVQTQSQAIQPTTQVQADSSNVQGSKAPEVIDISKAKVIYSAYDNTPNPTQPSQTSEPAKPAIPSYSTSPSKTEKNINSVTLTVPPESKPTLPVLTVDTKSVNAAIIKQPITTYSSSIPAQSQPKQTGTPATTPGPTYPGVQSYVQASTVSRLDPRFQQQQDEQTAQRAALYSNSQSQTPTPTPPQPQPQHQYQPQYQYQPQPVVVPPIQPINVQGNQYQAVQTNNLQSEPQSYQSVCTSPLAIYALAAAYKPFCDSFVVSRTDSSLPMLQSSLIATYPNYLSNGKLTSAFKQYQTYADILTYQLLYETIYGTFNAIIDINPYTEDLKLKSLSVVSFPIMEIDLDHCKEKDGTGKNCKLCQEGYRNFMGRCRVNDPACLQYITDQCGACARGHELVRGVCGK